MSTYLLKGTLGGGGLVDNLDLESAIVVLRACAVGAALEHWVGGGEGREGERYECVHDAWRCGLVDYVDIKSFR
jgi:hypothetical protein